MKSSDHSKFNGKIEAVILCQFAALAHRSCARTSPPSLCRARTRTHNTRSRHCCCSSACMIRPSSRASPRRARFPSRTLLFFSSLYLLSLSRTHSRNTCSVHAHHPRRCLFLHAPLLSSSAVVHKLNHNPKFQTFLSRLTAPTPERDPVSPSARRVPRPDFTVTHRPTFHFPLYFSSHHLSQHVLIARPRAESFNFKIIPL